MSAEVLREAAALMRERLERLAEECGLTSAAAVDQAIWFGMTDDYQTVDEAYDPTHVHISTFGHPAVALAVADWLDAEAAKVSEWTVTQMGRPVHYSTGRVSDYALAVARAYLASP